MMRLQRQDSWNPDRNVSRGYSRLVAALTVALLLVFVAAWVSLGFAAVARAADAVPAVKAAAPVVPSAPVAQVAVPAAAAAAAKSDFKVNLNVADLSQLALVPGIGPAKAKAIVTFRAGKSFQSTADVMKVKGIGPKNYAKMKMHLAVDGPAVQGVPPASRTGGTVRRH